MHTGTGTGYFYLRKYSTVVRKKEPEDVPVPLCYFVGFMEFFLRTAGTWARSTGMILEAWESGHGFLGGRGRDADAYREVCVIVPLIGGFNYGTEGKVFLFFDESSLVLDARCPC